MRVAFEKWDKYQYLKKSPTTGKPVSKTVEAEVYRAFKFYHQGDKVTAQRILDHLTYEAQVSTYKPPVPKGKELVPYKPPTGVKPPPVRPTALEPIVTPPPPVTGVPAMLTKPMEAQLGKLGYSATQIAKMTPEEAWGILYRPEAGMPEAGYQPAMMGVTEKIVRPAGKGRITQISMDEALALERARMAELIPPRAVEEVAVELDRVTAEIEGLTEYLNTEPARALIRLVKTFGKERGEIPNLTLKQYKDITGKDEIKPNILTPDKKHVRWEYALDDIATEMGYPSGDALREAVLTAREANIRLTALKAQKQGLTAEIEGLEAPIIGIRLPEALPTIPPPLAPEGEALGRSPNEFTGIEMADLQSADVVNDIAFRNDYVRRWINLLPEIKGLIRILNPSAVANTPTERASIIRATLRDEGRQKAQGVIAYLNELGTQEKIFGKVADDGTIIKGALKGLHPNEIRTYPKRYADKLTDEQKQWIERANDIEQAKLAFLKRNGIEINELTFEEGGRYAGRRVYAKVIEGEVLDTAYVGAGPGRPGARLAAEKQRVFKEIKDAVQAGYKYLPEDEALYLNIQGAYNRIADKQMTDWLLAKVTWRTTGASEELKLAAEAAILKKRYSQQLVAALNRAVRGERVPDVTIASIARSYPDQAQELKNLIPLLQEGAPTATRVRNLTRVAKGLVDTNKMEAQRAVNARARSREKALIAGYEEAMIPAPAFAGKILTGAGAKETSRILRQAFEPRFSEALRQVNKANAVGRYFMLAGDISPMTIQLIFLMGENPVTYVKAGAGLTRAIFDPRFHSNYLTKHKATIDKHPNLLLTKAGATEFTEAMARGGWLSGKQTLLPQAESYWKNLALIVPRTYGKIGGTVLTPFQRGFEAGLDVAGIEMAEAYDYMCTTPARTADVDQFINEFRGVTSSARIGVSPLQQQTETAAVLAPRYNRAIVSLLFDLGRGGIRGARARWALAKGIAALAILTALISIARGEDKEEILDHFNPNSSNFFTWDIAGQKVGPGSKVRSVVKLFAQSASNPDSLFQLSMDNPALRFLRGNLSPVVGAGIDLITGRSYIGDPTRDGMLSFSKEILAGNLLPIWVQTVLLEGGDVKGRTARGIAEFFGGRGYPESLWNEVGKLRDKYAKMDFNVKYEELNRGQIDKLGLNHPDLKELEDKARLEGATRGTELDKWVYETTEQITRERNDALENAAVALLRGLTSKRDYDNERGYARPSYSKGMAVLWSARESLDPYAISQINKWMAANQKPEDKALDKYQEYSANLIAGADLPKDWDKTDAQCEAYLSRLPTKYQTYIKANLNRWIKDLPPNARAVELWRLESIENETWWDNYWGAPTKPKLPTTPQYEQPSSSPPPEGLKELLDLFK